MGRTSWELDDFQVGLMELNSPQVSLLSQDCTAELLASAFESLWEVEEFLKDKEKSNKVSPFTVEMRR